MLILMLILMLWCMVLLMFFMTDGSSDNQLAYPTKKFVFFGKIRIVIKTRSTLDGHLSVNLEC